MASFIPISLSTLVVCFLDDAQSTGVEISKQVFFSDGWECWTFLSKYLFICHFNFNPLRSVNSAHWLTYLLILDFGVLFLEFFLCILDSKSLLNMITVWEIFLLCCRFLFTLVIAPFALLKLLDFIQSHCGCVLLCGVFACVSTTKYFLIAISEF